MNIHNVIKANSIKSSWRNAKSDRAKAIMFAYAERLKKCP